MGLFDFLKPKKQSIPEESGYQSVFRLQGPAYLRHYLKPVDPDILPRLRLKNKHKDIEWAGQVVAGNNNRFFSIRYLGKLLNKTTIVQVEMDVLKIVAIDVITQEEILVFDRSQHGWDGFAIKAAGMEHPDRAVTDTYTSPAGSTQFQLILVASYNQGTKDEVLDMANEQGNIVLENGTTLSLQEAFDDAFDGLTIYAFDENGKGFEIVSEELA